MSSKRCKYAITRWCWWHVTYFLGESCFVENPSSERCHTGSWLVLFPNWSYQTQAGPTLHNGINVCSRKSVTCLDGDSVNADDADFNTFGDLIKAIVEAAKANSTATNKWDEHLQDCKSMPLCEQLMLAPQPTLNDNIPNFKSTTQYIYWCLYWSQVLGCIWYLYINCQIVVSKPSSQLWQQGPSFEQVKCPTQLAADTENFGTANARLTTDMPVAPVNDSNTILTLRYVHPQET